MGDMLRFDAERLRILVERHLLYTGSARARELLEDWDDALGALRQGDADGLPPRAAATCGPSGQRRRRRRANSGCSEERTTMGKPTGFLEIERHDRGYEKPEARLKTWKEFVMPLPQPRVAAAGARAAWIAASRSVTTAARSTT